MAVRRVIHVTYNQAAERWFVWDVTGKKSKIMRRSSTKAAAVRYATRLAKSRRHIGQVVIHGMDGKIELEFSYGADPVNRKG